MKSQSFVRVASVDELSGDGPFAVAVSGVDVTLVRRPAGWRAFQGRCPHQGALLGEGEIEAGTLVCRNHRWRFALDSGKRVGGPECLASHPVVEREGAVFVDVCPRARDAHKPQATRSLATLPGPRPLPLFGNALQVDPARTHLVLEGWVKQYGPTYRIRTGPAKAVVTCEPAIIDEILRERPETFRRSDRTNRALSELGIKGVFNAEGEPWRPQRKLAVAALSQRHLRQLYPHVQTVARRIMRRWRQAATHGEPLDVVEEMKRFTVDVTMLIAFGHDANTVEQSGDTIQRHLERILPKLSQRIGSAFPLWRYIKLPGDRRLDRSLAAVRAWLQGLLEEARKRLAANPHRRANPCNFIESMIVAVDENGQPFSTDTIMSNLVTMLLAGEDTTAFTLSWAVHELCDSPKWAGELRREADAVMGETDAPADIDALNELAIAGAVANETMRLRPAAPLASATANVDTSLGEFHVPKGTTFVLLFRPPALSAANFADPLVFRPERWLGRFPGAHEPSASLPFGSGPRMCPGRSLALVEMKTLLSMLYRNFDVERVGASREVAERFGFTMSAIGLRVRLRARPVAMA